VVVLIATVDTIVNDIINNAVDLYFTKEEEGLKGNVVLVK
jgi:3D (Asp-Asp-Asp) domain-containing protein